MRQIETPHNGELFLFDSMTEVTDYVDPKQYSDFGKGFVGEDLPSWDHAQKRTVRDWAEGMYILKDFVQKLLETDIPEVKSHKRKTQFNETEGDEIDFDKLMAGEPFWRKSEREAQTGPTTMTVIIDTTTPANRDPIDVLWRGAAAIALTQILEEKGYSVELWVVNGSKLFAGKSTRVMTACCLKKCSDPLDTSTIINTVSGWFYRSITFALLETICRKTGNRTESGLGYCCTPTQEDLDRVTTDELRVYSAGVYSFDGALGVMQSELKKLADRE